MWVNGEWDGDKRFYDRLTTLPLAAWAWEYARRFPQLKSAAYRARRYEPHRVRRRDGGDVIRLRRRCLEAERFGLQFFPDPELSAFETTPFWLPEVSSSSLDAALELEPLARRAGERLRIDHLPGDRHFLIGPGRRPKLVVSEKTYAAQLAIEEDALPAPRALYFSLKLTAGALATKNLEPLEEFAAFCARRPVPLRAIRGHSPDKLRDAMIALDGELANAKRQCIATVLFGEERTRVDWNNGDETLKKKTKRLVEKGEKLMRGGYRKLL